MDFRNQLGKIHSKYTSIAIANEIANDPKKFKNLMDIILANEDIISARAAWALSFSIEANPDLLTPYCSKIIQLIPFQNYHHAVRRNILRVLRFVNIPANLKEKLIDDCFELSINQSETVAVRSFAVDLIKINAKEFPEIISALIEELSLQIADASPGIKSKIRQLKLLL
jgi:hypothetical protein